MSDFQIEKLKNSLDPLTIEYISQNPGSNLRDLTAQASESLRRLQSQATKDYMRVGPESQALLTEIESADSVLCRLETSTEAFAKGLNTARETTARLQTRSTDLHVELHNRRALAAQLAEFFDAVTLEPKAIESLARGEVDAEFREHLASFCRKLASPHLADPATLAAKELKPELEKLRLRVADKSKAALLSHISSASRPGAVDSSRRKLETDRILLFFLRNFALQDYLSVVSAYTKTISSAYVKNLRGCVSDLKGAFSSILNSRIELFTQGGVKLRISTRANRARDASFCVFSAPKSANQLHSDAAFQSLQGLLASTCVQEFKGAKETFALEGEERGLFVFSVMKMPILVVQEALVEMIERTDEIFSLLICGYVIEAEAERMKARELEILDNFFASNLRVVNTKTRRAFEQIIEDISLADPRTAKTILDSRENGDEVLFEKPAEFLAALAELAQLNRTSKDLIAMQLPSILQRLAEFSAKLAALQPSHLDALATEIRCLDILARETQREEAAFSEAAYAIKSRQISKISRLVEAILEDNFTPILKILRGSSPKEPKEPSLQRSEITEVASGFRDSWRRKLATVKAENSTRFKSKDELGNRVFKQIIAGVLELYQDFFAFSRKIDEGFATQLLQTHKLNSDINALFNV